jgi:glycosyltransferase involved in cell wall biosynthesis
VPQPRASVVIRTKDEAEHLGGVLDVLMSQTVRRDELEIIVVDSGSTDGTIAIASRPGIRVIEIPAEIFTYGRALNLGCEAAHGAVLVSLSGHAYPPDAGWVERLLGHFDDERVACATGAGVGPAGEPLTGPVLQSAELAGRYPFWGYSNAAGGFRAELWRQRPFREDMPGVEDKDWAWHWLHHGRLVALDPALNTIHDHSREPPLSAYRRARSEWRGFAMFLDVPPAGLGELAKKGWSNPDWKLRIHPGTWAGLLGQYLERRAGGP